MILSLKNKKFSLFFRFVVIGLFVMVILFCLDDAFSLCGNSSSTPALPSSFPHPSVPVPSTTSSSVGFNTDECVWLQKPNGDLVLDPTTGKPLQNCKSSRSDFVYIYDELVASVKAAKAANKPA
jgi:hypothetical protein